MIVDKHIVFSLIFPNISIKFWGLSIQVGSTSFNGTAKHTLTVQGILGMVNPISSYEKKLSDPARNI